jgi:hypothetical protein
MSRTVTALTPPPAPSGRSPHAFAEPLEPPALERVPETRARDQDVVVPGRQVALDLLEGGSQPAFDPVALDGASELTRDRETQARAERVAVFPRERIEDEIARRRGTTVTVDRVEVPRAREAMPALQTSRLVAGLRPRAASALLHGGA